MAREGICFQPKIYLSDEWGCPDRVPIIGVPFYLVDPELSRLEGQLTGFDVEDDAEVMKYLRHEAGHAFNYAYRLYCRKKWRRTFGRFSQPYGDDYQLVPFSSSYVRHIEGWYSQKHPDDDFAETFAVWLTPHSDWRKRYANTPALTKLLYVDQAVRTYGKRKPVVIDEKLDTPVQEMAMTLDTWYRTRRASSQIHLTLNPILNSDLQTLFPMKHGQSATNFLRLHRKQLIRDVNQWTGISRKLVTALVDELADRVQSLGLKIEPKQTSVQAMKLSAFVTTLAMNYLCFGQFIDQGKPLSKKRRVKQVG